MCCLGPHCCAETIPTVDGVSIFHAIVAPWCGFKRDLQRHGKVLVSVYTDRDMGRLRLGWSPSRPSRRRRLVVCFDCSA